MAARSRAHALENPENVQERAEVRRSRQQRAGPRCSKADISHLRKLQEDQCAYCMTELEGAGYVDHMTPLSKGGTNDIGNLVLACFQCNAEKHAKTANQYFLWRFMHGVPLCGEAYAWRLLYEDE